MLCLPAAAYVAPVLSERVWFTPTGELRKRRPTDPDIPVYTVHELSGAGVWVKVPLEA